MGAEHRRRAGRTAGLVVVLVLGVAIAGGYLSLRAWAARTAAESAEYVFAAQIRELAQYEAPSLDSIGLYRAQPPGSTLYVDGQRILGGIDEVSADFAREVAEGEVRSRIDGDHVLFGAIAQVRPSGGERTPVTVYAWRELPGFGEAHRNLVLWAGVAGLGAVVLAAGMGMYVGRSDGAEAAGS